jgi:hypothetical protein
MRLSGPFFDLPAASLPVGQIGNLRADRRSAPGPKVPRFGDRMLLTTGGTPIRTGDVGDAGFETGSDVPLLSDRLSAGAREPE